MAAMMVQHSAVERDHTSVETKAEAKIQSTAALKVDS